MKIKKPSLKGMKNTGYLGHFSQDKYIEQGHNFSGKVPVRGQGVAMWTKDPRDVEKEKKTPRVPETDYGPQENYGPAGDTEAEFQAVRNSLVSRLKQNALDSARQKLAARVKQTKDIETVRRNVRERLKKEDKKYEDRINKREAERREIFKKYRGR